jgi:hypothetical protein
MGFLAIEGVEVDSFSWFLQVRHSWCCSIFRCNRLISRDEGEAKTDES